MIRRFLFMIQSVFIKSESIMSLRTHFLAASFLSLSLPCAANDQLIIEHFGKRTLSDIKAERVNQPFLVVFWSKDCGYCVKEMDMLGDMRPDNPDMEVVLISTDTDLDPAEAEQLLNQTGLDVDRIWVFEKAFTDHMYASIDETWRGELPNTLFINSKHEFQSVKGAVSQDMVQGWLEYVREERPAQSEIAQQAPAPASKRKLSDTLGDFMESLDLF